MRYYVYDLYTYDVCGNKKDGFEVNNRFKTESGIVIAESELETDEKILKAMRRLGFINKQTKCKSINIFGENQYTLYFEDVRQRVGGLYPLFELRCTKIIG